MSVTDTSVVLVVSGSMLRQMLARYHLDWSVAGTLSRIPCTLKERLRRNRWFEKAAATVWDNLPVDTRTFKTPVAIKKVRTNLPVSAFLAE